MAAATKVQNWQISNYPISKVLLDGLYDPDCLLSQLRGCQHVMRRIWEELLIYWVRAIRLPQKDLEKGEYMGRISKANENRPQPFYLTPIDMDPDVGGYGFPVRENTKDPININMMPFIAAAEFEECKLPECVRPYWSLIKACLAPEMDRSWHHLWPARRIPSEKGKVNYLTIQESWVDEGSSQRRAGLHVDSPGRVKIKNGLDTTAGCSQKGDGQEDLESPAGVGNSVQDGGAEGGDADERRQEDGFETEGNVDNGLLKKFKPHVKGGGDSQPYNGHRWGLGCCHYVRQVAEEDTFRYPSDRFLSRLQQLVESSYVLQGGIYVASNLPNSSRAWDCRVDVNAIGRLGDVEHLRGVMPEGGRDLEAGRLYWLTDRTPHESLPLKKGAFRQFFRLVTSQVSLWYADHSTPNPLGVKPDPAITRIVVGDKFSEEGVELLVQPPDLSEPLKCGVAEDEVVEDDDPHPEEAILEHSSEEES